MNKSLISMLVMVSSLYAWSHGDKDLRISIEPESTGQYLAGNFEYTFQLYDNKQKKVVTDSDLIISQTKKLHFIAYDPALKAFNHVHPDFDGKIWKVNMNFSKNGHYFLWAQGELIDKSEFSSMTRALVIGGEADNVVKSLGDVRTGVDQGTQITLSKVKIKAGKMAMIDFTISRTDGKSPVLTPYLGAFAHVIATPADGDQLNHVHPVKGKKPNTGLLHATFSDAGDYRLWVQIIDSGVLKAIPLSVSVSK